MVKSEQLDVDAPRSPTALANAELRALWRHTIIGRTWPAGLPKYWPLQYQSMSPGHLMFIGINPSHHESDNPLLTVRGEADLADPTRMAEVLRRDETVMGIHGGSIYKYFRPFEQFEPGKPVNHVDLLAVRHMKQHEVRQLLALDKPPSPFVRQQMSVCLRLVAALRPPCVVVANAHASKMLLNFSELRLEWDDDDGHHWASTASGKTPWFFSGMLSGAGQIDAHSRRRLVWHVRRALARVRSVVAKPA